MKTVLVDLDGVLVSFLDEALKPFNTNVADLYEASESKGEWAVEKLLGITQKKFWEKNPGSVFEKARMTNDADDIMSVVEDFAEATGAKIFFCTSPSQDPDAYTAKARWVKRYYNDLYIKGRLIITSHKYLLANPDTVLIDDSDKNCEAFMQAGGHVVLVPRPWNSMWEAAEQHAKDDGMKTSIADALKQILTLPLFLCYAEWFDWAVNPNTAFQGQEPLNASFKRLAQMTNQSIIGAAS